MNYASSIYGAAVILACVILIYWANKHPEFTLTDLITGDNNRVSLRKFSALVALFSSTWAMVTLVDQGKLSEWFFTAYIGVWAAQKAATDITATITGNKP